jgi:hypothetical protein
MRLDKMPNEVQFEYLKQAAITIQETIKTTRKKDHLLWIKMLEKSFIELTNTKTMSETLKSEILVKFSDVAALKKQTEVNYDKNDDSYDEDENTDQNQSLLSTLLHRLSSSVPGSSSLSAGSSSFAPGSSSSSPTTSPSSSPPTLSSVAATPTAPAFMYEEVMGGFQTEFPSIFQAFYDANDDVVSTTVQPVTDVSYMLNLLYTDQPQRIYFSKDGLQKKDIDNRSVYFFYVAKTGIQCYNLKPIAEGVNFNGAYFRPFILNTTDLSQENTDFYTNVQLYKIQPESLTPSDIDYINTTIHIAEQRIGFRTSSN